MCTVDIVILICFLPALVQGLKNGFIKQAIDLATLVVGAWMAFRFSETVSAWIAGYFPQMSPTLLMIISFVVVFLVVMLLLSLLGRLLKGILKLAMLGWADRLLGLAFALLKAALVIGIVIFLFEAVNQLTEWVRPEDIADSKLYGPLKEFAGKVFPYFKSFVHQSAEVLPNV